MKHLFWYGTPLLRALLALDRLLLCFVVFDGMISDEFWGLVKKTYYQPLSTIDPFFSTVDKRLIDFDKESRSNLSDSKHYYKI